MAFVYAHRFVDYSATKDNYRLDRALLRFIYGVRGDKRKNPVSLKQITEYFRATPPSFTTSTLDQLIEKHYVVLIRAGIVRNRPAIRYAITNMGCSALHGDSTWDTPNGRLEHVEATA